MELYLWKYNKGEQLISEPKSIEEMWEDIHNKLVKMGAHNYCTGSWIDEEKLYIDFGSHTSFFKVSALTIADMKLLFRQQ